MPKISPISTLASHMLHLRFIYWLVLSLCCCSRYVCTLFFWAMSSAPKQHVLLITHIPMASDAPSLPHHTDISRHHLPRKNVSSQRRTSTKGKVNFLEKPIKHSFRLIWHRKVGAACSSARVTRCCYLIPASPFVVDIERKYGVHKQQRWESVELDESRRTKEKLLFFGRSSSRCEKQKENEFFPPSTSMNNVSHWGESSYWRWKSCYIFFVENKLIDDERGCETCPMLGPEIP